MVEEGIHLEMKQVRCKKCGRLLFKGMIKEVQIKCPKCGYLQTINCQKKVDILYKKT